MPKKNSSESNNAVVIALKYVYGPLVAKSAALPPPLAYGLPVLVTILLIAVLKAALPANIAWLLALAIVVPMLGYVVTSVLVRGESHQSHTIELPAQASWADIESPKPKQVVDRTIECSGSAKGIPPNMHLWLAVEERNFILPKEGDIIVDRQGKWKGRIFEDGVAEEFAISLFMADVMGDQYIRSWLESGQRSGYLTLTGIPGSRRITRVDKLRLKARA
jgi:hypothetical protein